MTHVDDLYEPGDDREPEPCEWYPAPEPVDLDAIEDSIRTYYTGSDDDSAKAAEGLVTIMSRLVAEHQKALQRIAEFEALPTREEWAVTDGPEIPPASGDFLPEGGHAERAFMYARQENGQAWRQRLTVHPPELISPDAPF